MKAAKESDSVDTTYVSTDFDEIMAIAEDLNLNTIERDPELATDKASGWDAFKDGYETISERESEDVEAIVLLLCNCPTLTADMIDEGIRMLRQDEDLDSVVPVSKYNMRSPVRARKIEEERLELFMSVEEIEGASSHRDTQANTYFADGTFIIRPHCFNMDNGDPHLPVIGTNVKPLKNEAGLDVDFEWQLPQAKYWLQEHGFTSDDTPYN